MSTHPQWRLLNAGLFQQWLDNQTKQLATTGELKQHYPSLFSLVRHHKVMLPAPKETWRLLQQPCLGNINGLPDFRGIAVATNGIIVAIEDPVMDLLFFGHLEWFVKENDNASDLDVVIKAKRPSKKKDSKLDELFADYWKMKTCIIIPIRKGSTTVKIMDENGQTRAWSPTWKLANNLVTKTGIEVLPLNCRAAKTIMDKMEGQVIWSVKK